MRGITFYTRAVDEDGVLRDVFVADRRDPEVRMIYTAAEAYLVRNAASTSLIMVDGLAQRLRPDTRELSTAKFQDLSFDITPLMQSDGPVATALTHRMTFVLMQDWRSVAETHQTTTGVVAEEVHSRFARAAFCIVTALIGFATLLVGGYSRFGVWREIVIAFLLLIVLDGSRSTLTEPVLQDASLWPVLYLPSAVGAVMVVALLWSASHPGWTRRIYGSGAAT